MIGALRRRVRHTADEDGSVMLLTLGYAVLALTLVFVCVDATSLYLAQKRLDSLADAAALAGADAFTFEVLGGEPSAALTSEGVWAGAEALVVAVGGSSTLVAAATPDGVSARVTVAGSWHPPVFSLFVPQGVALEATATSRTALR